MAASLPYPTLCLVTDMDKVGKDGLLKIIDESVQGGVNLVQVREKQLTKSALESLVLDVVDIINGRALLAVNSNLEASQLPGVDFLHLPESESGFSSSFADPFGQSVHSVAAAKLAQQNGAKYVVVGSVFTTQSHPDIDPVGPSILMECNVSLVIPFVGIGGINVSNAAETVKLGAHGVAVISAILAADKPKLAAAQLMDIMLDETGQ